jgi:hypothetical protein
MAVNLSTAQSGDVFLTQGGRRLIYLAEKNDLSLTPYSYCLKCQNTGDSYYYSVDGIHSNHLSFPKYNLACIEKQVGVNILQNTNNLQNTTNLDSNDEWALALKVLAWVVFVVCVVASIILFGDYQADIAWIPLVYGVLQLVPTMVIANISANLKKSNQIQNAILGELKKQNK